jgi:LacI family transcriptional regulator
MSLSKETQFKADFHHISEVIDQGIVVMFDRVNEILCDKVIIDKQAAYEGSKPDRQRKKENRARHHR